jgi:TonB family protein
MIALEAELVELDTEIGSIYVRPLGWERLYMLWTFRHFRSLPQQVLSGRQRAVIDSLCRFAVANPPGQVDPAAIIGRVENIPVMGPLARSLSEVQPQAAREAAEPAYQGAAADEADEYARVCGNATSPQPAATGPAPRAQAKPRGEEQAKAADASFRQVSKPGRRGLRHGLAMPAALILAALVMAAVATRQGLNVADDNPRPEAEAPTTQRVRAAPAAVYTARPSLPAARPEAEVQASPGSAWTLPYVPMPPAPPSSANVSARRASSTPAAPRRITPTMAAAVPAVNGPEHPQLAEFFGAPQEALVRPEYPSGGGSGTVILRATVAANGRVASVETLSGRLPLARAAAHAMKAWRYRPYLSNGEAVEFQTKAVFRFSGGEVISIIFPGS